MRNPRIQRIFVTAVIAVAGILSLLFLMAINRDKLMIRGESEHFVFYCYKNEARYIPKLSESMENAFERGTAALNYTPGGKVSVTLYHTQEAFDQATGLPSRSAASSTEGLSVYIGRDSGEEPYENAAYEAVRSVLRRLQAGEPNSTLSCAAALLAVLPDTQSLFAGLTPEQAPSLDSLFQAAPDVTLAGFHQSQKWQYDVLFASFVSTLNTNRGLGLLLRDGAEPNYSQATGVDKETLDALWKQWLLNKGQSSQ